MPNTPGNGSSTSPTSASNARIMTPEAVANKLPPLTADETRELVFSYLQSRGFTKAEQVLRDEILSSAPITDKGAGRTLSTSDLVRKNVPKIIIDAGAGGGPSSSTASQSEEAAKQRLAIAGYSNAQAKAALGNLMGVAAEDALSSDGVDRHDGFRDLESWVDGSLDIYRPEFRRLLYPVFCHFYLDLVQMGLKDSALNFYRTFRPSLDTSHGSMLHHLSTLLLPSHVVSDELATRFRKVAYRLQMSKSGFGLFIGWLTDGIGGTGGGAGEGFGGEKGRRGRTAVLRVINEHIKIDVAAATASVQGALEESTGLEIELFGSGRPSTTATADPKSYNAAAGALKLGQPPMDPALKEEAARLVKDELGEDAATGLDPAPAKAGTAGALIQPAQADMPPMPPSYREMDVKREVAKVVDQRKRIRIDPSVVTINSDLLVPGRRRTVALPSICMYTLYDAPDGNVPCASFSADSSLLVAGFEESYIRLWNLKGEKIRGLRSDFDASSVRDDRDLRRYRERGGSSTRKLIGHSGPVYATQFDPLAGSSGPPHWLLSASADATVRLWSLETLTNVVAYRGHESPVWDVQWSPLGTYFISGGRDRTARLWSTDRIAPLRVFAGHLSDVDCVQFHPNSLYVATGSSDWTARLWDVQRGNCMRIFQGHQGGVNCMAFSPDGRYLATAADDLAISLWDLGSGKRIKKMSGHAAAIYSLSFSAESSVLVSGSADWTVRCWDVNASGGLPGQGKGKASGDDIKIEGNGTLPFSISNELEDRNETTDLLATFPTKRTPIISIQFTPRNMCLAAGPILPPPSHV